MVSLAAVEEGYRRFQENMIGHLEHLDGEGRFGDDPWTRPQGGGGVTRVLSGGRHIEKAAVNFSSVFGDTPSGLSERIAAAGSSFHATGVSIIIHPRNPYAPAFHANIRYFESDTESAWFGGGADLTPSYLFEEDAYHFHSVLAGVCSRHPSARYQEWKKACDDYFRLHHRGESRGVGGLFFDHITDDLDDTWAFQQDLAADLPNAYLPILERRMSMPYGADQSRWHRIRRSRYAEFNLIWDRGTRFGLETGGRIESILASLPPVAEWVYDFEPEPGSPEALLLSVVRSPARSWL